MTNVTPSPVLFLLSSGILSSENPPHLFLTNTEKKGILSHQLVLSLMCGCPILST